MIVELHERTYMTHGATTNKEKSEHSWSSRIWLCSTGATQINLRNERNEARLRSSKSLWEDAFHSLQVSGWASYSDLLSAQQINQYREYMRTTTVSFHGFNTVFPSETGICAETSCIGRTASLYRHLLKTNMKTTSVVHGMFLASEVEPPIHVVLWLLGASELQLCIGTHGAIAGETDVSRDEIHKEIQWWSKTPKIDHWRVTMKSKFFVSMALKSECSRCFNPLQIQVKWTFSNAIGFDGFPKALYKVQLTQWPEDTGAGDVMAPQDWHATFVVPMGAISTWVSWVASGFTL